MSLPSPPGGGHFSPDMIAVPLRMGRLGGAAGVPPEYSNTGNFVSRMCLSVCVCTTRVQEAAEVSEASDLFH